MTRKILVVSVFCAFAITPPRATALFGSDVVVLVQILSNAIKQLYELQQIVRNARDTLNFMQDINRGINDSLRVIESLGGQIDPGVYRELKKYTDLSRHLGEIYGTVSPSLEAHSLLETDQVAMDAIGLHNNLYDYANSLDRIGEEIKRFSHETSPGGAQKLTAQGLGVMIHVQDQQLRATSTALKISAQDLLMRNRERKAESKEYLNQANLLKSKMQSHTINFDFPRF